MELKSLYALLLVLFLLKADQHQEEEEEGDDLSIESIYAFNGGSSLAGSLRGGTELFIWGYGFDKSNIENNLVFMGDYSCHVKHASMFQLRC